MTNSGEKKRLTTVEIIVYSTLTDAFATQMHAQFTWRYSFPEFRDKAVLKDVFQEAIKRKLIHQPFLAKQDDLYYLRYVS